MIETFLYEFYNSDSIGFQLARKNKYCKKKVRIMEHDLIKHNREMSKIMRDYYIVKKGKRFVKVVLKRWL